MDATMIWEIVKIVIYVVLGGLAIYFKTTTKLNQKVNDLIAKAEFLFGDVTKAGGTKFKYVVDKLYEFLPAPLRLIIPRSLIETIVQNTFNAMEKYAKDCLDRIGKKYTD